MHNDRQLIPLSAVKQERIKWLWTDRIPLGAITLIEGDPGQSKSTLTYDIAARVTAGKPMPFAKKKMKPAGVVVAQAEDSLGGTVKPTLVAAGADIDRVRVYDGELFLAGPLALPDDLRVIEAAAKEVEAKLVILDPLSAFVSGNPNSDQSIRKALGPLAALAARMKLAVVIARHLRKQGSTNPLYGGAGSIGIIALARSVLWVTRDPGSSDPYRHLLVQTKTNLSTAASLLYRTSKQGNSISVEWLGESAYVAKDLASMAGVEHSALDEACAVLREILAGRPMEATDVMRLAKEAGVAKRTLDRAKRLLGVRSEKKGGGWSSRWLWRLPDGDGSPQPGTEPPNGKTVNGTHVAPRQTNVNNGR